MRGYRYLAEWMKALAHPVRLQILEVLEQEGEACVCHLEARLNQRQPYVSQQLSRLREAGMVEARREGLNIYYAISSESIKPILDQVRQSAGEISRSQGKELKFKDIPEARPEECACPKCQQKTLQAEIR